MEIAEAIDNTIRRWKSVKASLTTIKCDICLYANSVCKDCPIKRYTGSGCIKEYTNILKAIDKFIVVLEDKKSGN